MRRERQIYNAFMRAIKEGCVPFGYYGPETCRWATPEEMRGGVDVRIGVNGMAAPRRCVADRWH
jgi:hypothetical protein